MRPPVPRVEPLVRAALDRLPAETQAHARAAASEAAAAVRSLADAVSDAREELFDRISTLVSPRDRR